MLSRVLYLPFVMLTCQLYFVFIFCIISFFLFMLDESKAVEWCYGDSTCEPRNWPDTCQTGKHQSPIDIPMDDPSNDEAIDWHTNPHYSTCHDYEIHNNGHSVSLSLEKDKSSKAVVTGGLFHGEHYIFGSLHFHWESEHTIDGKRYPLEIHVVHYKSIYKTLTEALAAHVKDPTAVAVLARFFDTEHECGPADILDPILHNIEKIRQVNKQVHGCPINLARFFPEKRNRVKQYIGSLTTPTCTEAVTWNIFTAVLPMTQKQLDAFRQLESNHGRKLLRNFRPRQPLNGRKIHSYYARRKSSVGHHHYPNETSLD